MRRAIAAAALLLPSACVGPGRPSTPPPGMPIAPAPSPVATRGFRLDVQPVQGGLIHGQAATGTTALTLDGNPVPLATDGSFILGFDRDAPPAMTLVEQGAGAPVVHPLAVVPGAWRIERVDAPYRAGRTDAEFDAVRPAELARIAAARTIVTDAEGWRQPFRWPAVGRQSGWFGAGRVYQGKPGGYHSGADIAVPTGTPVLAPADGVVILAADAPFTLEGNLLMIDHGMGLNSALLHLSRIDVRVGERVRQGQAIALSGATGRVSGPHLHWGLQWQGAKLDPLLAAGPVPGA